MKGLLLEVEFFTHKKTCERSNTLYQQLRYSNTRLNSFTFRSCSSSMDSGSIQEFAHFDVVPEAADHYYLHSHKTGKARKCFNGGNTPLYAHIMKEWKSLARNLPESIYVRVHETRIDLLRAVIIGPAGTPYHDGLFFFDIVLPCDYPNKPPEVHYHSHGYRLNPNLYANGTVCLSLINTWSGSKAEKWTRESTILQILVSIQGLVLNERPYFNEPGFEVGKNNMSATWVNRSIEYSEGAFILSCKTMLQTMRKPPNNFESFVAQHFRGRAASILAAIKDYQTGRVLVGRFQMNAAASSSSSVKVSRKFKANLMKIDSDLKKAFANLTSEPKGEKNGTTSETGQNVNKDPCSIVKPQENVENHKNGLLKTLKKFVKWILK